MISDFFLKAKHWHLFLLTFCLPLVAQFILVIIMILNLLQGATIENIAVNYIVVFPLAMILSMITYGWHWSVAIGLQGTLPTTLAMNTRRFKLAFFTFLSCMLISSIAGMFMLRQIFSAALNESIPDITSFIGTFAVIFPLNMVGMVCSIYCIYFVAKTFKTAELRQSVTFSDFVGEFFLIWFFPVGIWFIQPTINALITANPDQPHEPAGR